MTKSPSMKRWKHFASVLVALGIGLAATGCSRDKNAQAASDTTNQPKLFSIPPEQMSHIQVVTVQPGSIERVLRLPGTVAYNGFTTTPVISQVSGPVGRIAVVPGQIVHAGEPMLYVSSPDFAQLRSNYLKASDAHALAHKNYARAQDLYAIMRSPSAICRLPNPPKCRRRQTSKQQNNR